MLVLMWRAIALEMGQNLLPRGGNHSPLQRIFPTLVANGFPPSSEPPNSPLSDPSLLNRNKLCSVPQNFDALGLVLKSCIPSLGGVAYMDHPMPWITSLQWIAMMEEHDPPSKLCTRMRLWEFPDLYMIEACDTIVDIPQSAPGTTPKTITIFGLVGMLKLIAGTYVLVITERECVGSYFGCPIFRISSIQVLPCDQTLNSSSELHKKLENEFKSLFSSVQKMHGLYFSYDKDLTLSLQRSHALKEDSKNLPLWRQADPRFLWNNYMLELLIENKVDPYILPVIQGRVRLSKLQRDHREGNCGGDFDSSKMHKKNRRMWRRGADTDGYVANFVETEQLVDCTSYTASFVQVRGSMPFLWKQIVNLTYKPSFEILNSEEAPQVAERHFLDLRRTYGSALAIDLVNKHGGEGRLTQVFSNAMQKISSNDIRYVHFDFHHICGHIHFERLSLLYDQIADFLKSRSYFMSDKRGEKLEEQKGVVRTNCVDCLDRTNVTQSMIGRRMLETQLRRIGVLGDSDTIANYVSFDGSFKIMWANHGDDISIQYSGTPALKGDFVRYGKRKISGVINDGYNALARYYLNNFCDGTKQDAIDLLHGHYIVAVSRGMSSPFKAQGMEAFASVPLAGSLVLAGLTLATISLRKAHQDARHLLLSVMWAALAFGTLLFMKAKGRLFCNRPHLLKP